MPRPRRYTVTYNLNCLYCKEPFTKDRVEHEPAPKFCSHKCYGLNKRGAFILKNGYRMIICKGHPRANQNGYVREHIIVMEKKLGRLIPRGESIHHIDGNKQNNDPENLEHFASHREHLLHHWNEENLRKKNGKRTST